MTLTGEQRVNWVLDQYKDFLKVVRKRKIYAGLIIALLGITLIIGMTTEIPPLVRSVVAIMVGFTALGFLFAAARGFSKELDYFLPEIEDRLLCFSKPATVSLAAFVSYNKPSDKEKTLKSLERVADMLDEWYPGSLSFIKEGAIGTRLKDLQTNFRFGLLPFVKKAKNTQMGSVELLVGNIEKTLEQTPKVSEYILETWAKLLADFLPPKLPLPFWRKIPTTKSHILKGIVIVGVTAATAVIGLYINAGTAFLGAIAMFGIVVVILIFLAQKRKPE